MSFQFSGLPSAGELYATLQNLNASIYIDGVLNASVVTDGTVTPTFGTRLDISGLTDTMHTMRIECAASQVVHCACNYSSEQAPFGYEQRPDWDQTAEWLPGGTLLVPEALPQNVTHVLIKLGTNDGNGDWPGYMAGAQGTFVNPQRYREFSGSTYP